MPLGLKECGNFKPVFPGGYGFPLDPPGDRGARYAEELRKLSRSAALYFGPGPQLGQDAFRFL
jgi:hypothetical protein